MGVDLDDCIDPKTGDIEPWAAKIIEKLDSYTELSPSGTGVHIITKGEIPANGKMENGEMYSAKQFFTMTGHHLPGRTTIRDRKETLVRLHAELFSRSEENGKANGSSLLPAPPLDDDQVIKLCRRAKNSDKFGRLFDQGDTSEYGGDDSRADQALIGMLAFYTQDHDQLDRLFRGSALYREEKWGQRLDYRRRTMEKALSGLRESYSAPGAVGLQEGKNGHQDAASPSSSLYKGLGRRDDRPEAVKLADMELPGPRQYVLKNLIPSPYVTLFYGDGGVAKSLLALALALAVGRGSKRWLGLEVEEGPVLYFDAELDVGEQVRRADQLRCGLSLEKLPDGLLYMSALGFGIREALAAALETL